MKRLFYVNFVVKGLNFERLINKLKGVEIFNVKKSEKRLSFSVKPCDKRQIVDILRHSLYNEFEILDVTPKNLFIKNIEKIVAILVFFVISLLPVFFIFDAEVICEDKTLKRVLEESLAPYQNQLTIKSEINEDEIQKEILSIDKVSIAQVKIMGGKLYLYANKEIESVKEQNLFEIYSYFDGTITKIITLSGTPKVKVGDKVKKGDLLIDGSVFSDKTGKSEKVKAIGNVYGVLTIEKSVKIPKSTLVKSETGKITIKRSLKFLGLQNDIPSPYQYYTVKTQERYLCENFFLPIKIVSKEFHELSGEIIDTVVEEEIEKLANEEKNKIIEIESKILSQNIEVTEIADYYIIKFKTNVERKFN